MTITWRTENSFVKSSGDRFSIRATGGRTFKYELSEYQRGTRVHQSRHETLRTAKEKAESIVRGAGRVVHLACENCNEANATCVRRAIAGTNQGMILCSKCYVPSMHLNKKGTVNHTRTVLEPTESEQELVQLERTLSKARATRAVDETVKWMNSIIELHERTANTLRRQRDQFVLACKDEREGKDNFTKPVNHIGFFVNEVQNGIARNGRLDLASDRAADVAVNVQKGVR